MFSNKITETISDFSQRINLRYKIGYLEVVNQYRRTVFGPIWYTINILIFSFAMTIVYGALFGIPTIEYSVYVITGMITWQWISSIISDGGAAFINSKHFMMNPDISNDDIIWFTSIRFFLVFLHQVALIPILILLGLLELNFNFLLLFINSLLYFILSLQLVSVLSYCYARYRDLQKLVSASMIIILMLTPIFWMPQFITGWRIYIVKFNPFHHLVEIIRQPLMGEIPSVTNYIIVLSIICFACIFNYSLKKKHHKTVVFWV